MNIDKAFDKWRNDKYGDKPTEYDKEGYCTKEFLDWEDSESDKEPYTAGYKQSRIDTLKEIQTIYKNNTHPMDMIIKSIDTELNKGE